MALLLSACTPPIAGQAMPIDEELTLHDEYLRANPHDIPAYLEAAKRLWTYRGERAQVLALAETCIANNAGKAEAYLAAAMMLQMVGESARARTHASRYTELQPRDDRGWLLLAEIVTDDEPGEAVAILDQATVLFGELLDEAEAADADADAAGTAPEEASPLPAAARLRLALLRLTAEQARLLAQGRRYDAAYEALQTALADPRLAAMPGAWQLHEAAARLEVRNDRLTEAEVRLQQVLGESAARPEAIRTLAWLLFLDARAEEATYTLASLLRRTEQPEARLTIYVNLGYAELLAGRPEQALPAAERALEIDGRSVAALLLRYQVLRLLEREARYRSAGEDLARERVARFRVPARIATLQLMLSGVFAQHFYLTVRARDAFSRARDMEPSLGWPLLALAQLEQDAGNYTAAIEQYMRALDVEPALRPDILCSVADCYFARGEVRMAVRYYEQAIEAVPTHPRAARGKQRAEAVLAAQATAGRRD